MNALLLLSALSAALAPCARAAAPVPNLPEEVRPLAVGAAVPDASLRTLDGKPVTLKKSLAGRPTVLVFYRGGWCPYCNAHLRELKDAQKGLAALGYQTLALTPDRPEEVGKTLTKHDLPYRILSDSKMEAARALGVAFRVDDETVEKYVGYGIDLEKSSGEKHHWLPVPGLFLVDRSGKIAFASADPDYKVRLKAAELLKAAKAASPAR